MWQILELTGQSQSVTLGDDVALRTLECSYKLVQKFHKPSSCTIMNFICLRAIQIFGIKLVTSHVSKRIWHTEVEQQSYHLDTA